MSSRIQILVVEDNPADAELLVRELRRSGFDFDWQRVDTEAEYLAKLSSNLHLIISDFEMPEFSGLQALKLLKQQPTLDIPFIIVSGAIGEETAVAAMREGATDFLLKDRIVRLAPVVRRALQEVLERSARKRLEVQFIEAQKMEVVGQLAGGIAHDFNNALGVIMGYSELVLGNLGSDHPSHGQIEQIQRAAERAAGLTRQLLVSSRKQIVQAVELDVNEVVNGMEKLLRQILEENIEMTVVYGAKIGTIKADSGYVWQVLMNLVINARDSMPGGGKIAIQTSAVMLDGAYAQAHPGVAAGAYVMLSISDTGTGMTEEVKARLFEAFFTTKPAGKGTGLGLITCQTVVRQSGGHIDVSSELGRGTTFKIYFPRIGQPLPIAVSPASKTEVPSRGMETILVVEDEPSLRHVAELILKTRGYNVLTAPNGEDALRVADKHQGEGIALVVTDVIMPGMSGKTMADRLRTTSPHLKILFTSGYTDDVIAHHGVLEEGIAFLPKPYTVPTLTRKVRELLDASQSLGTSSTFHVEIPVERGDAGVAVGRGPRRRVIGIQAGQEVPRILIAGDLPENRNGLLKLLTAIGFPVRGADDGEAAVREWREWSPGLILMDVHMPVMDGLEATRRIKAAPGGKETAIVIMTASVLDEDRRKVRQSGADDFLAKPCREEVLLEKVRALLNIAYDYEDTGESDSRPDSPAGPLWAEKVTHVTQLPHELIEQLRDATSNGDKRLLNKLIARVDQSKDAEFARDLQNLADRYEYDALTRLLEEACR